MVSAQLQDKSPAQPPASAIGAVEAQPPKSDRPTPSPDQAVPEAAAGTTLPAAPPKKLSIHGACHGPDGKPISDAGIRVFQCRSLDRPILRGEATTDAEGRYTLREVELSADSGILCVAATCKGYASAVQMVKETTGEINLPIELSTNVGTLSGAVTDQAGRPVKDAVVFFNNCYGRDPLPGIFAGVTDGQGRYAITDLKRWSPAETKTVDRKTRMTFMTTSVSVIVEHRDYPRTVASASAVPQTVNVTLKPAAIVEGRVIDSVTQKAVANVVVSAQGIVRHALLSNSVGPRRPLSAVDDQGSLQHLG